MAARENQGYLIAVIILVLLSLVLALAAFLGLSKMSEYADNKAAAEKSLNVEKKVSQAYSIQCEILKAYVGELGPAVAEVPTQVDSLKRLATSGDLDATEKSRVQAIIDSVVSVQEIFEKDKLGIVATSEEGQAPEFTYKALIKNLSTVLAKKYSENNITRQQALLAQTDAETKIAQMQTQVQQMESTVTTLQTDLKNEKQLAADKQLALTKSLETGAEELRNANTKYDDFKMKTDADMGGLQTLVSKTEEQNATLKTKINGYEREVFDLPDGHVVKVATALNAVYIDLGRADGLTENRFFAVYDQSVTNFEKNRHKATIEVTKLMDHQAEARITDEDPTNPILSGDYVLTATWDPGYAVPMALAGKFDLDHDGFSDLDKLIQMIKRNGGDVVAWHDEEGNIQGKIDASVRYLVLGEPPSLGPDAKPAVVQAMKTMQSQAEENTIQVINLQKLLNKMGIRAIPKIEKVDRRISSQGFETRQPSDSLKSSDK